jgi:hypothetical protein
VAAAAGVLGPVAAGAAVTPGAGPEAGWLTVGIDPARGAEVNRALAGAGIFASRLETGTTLEGLFLELTGSQPDVGEGGPPAPGGEAPPTPPATGWRS